MEMFRTQQAQLAVQQLQEPKPKYGAMGASQQNQNQNLVRLGPQVGALMNHFNIRAEI